ncbi:protein argonaute [Trifolium repens]|nr:protein argonaute [Trifolium repens]
MSIPNGDFKLAGTNIVNTPFSVVEGEAMALAEAMKEMLQRGLSYVVFESDSKIVVDAISSRQSCVSEFSLLISYIQSILSLHNYFEVKYVRRQANKTLPSLAFIEPLPLIDTVAQILGKDVYSKPITDADRVKIKKALKGVKVEVTYRGRFRRKYRITGVTSQPTRELLYVIVIFSVNFTFYIFVL